MSDPPKMQYIQIGLEATRGTPAGSGGPPPSSPPESVPFSPEELSEAVAAVLFQLGATRHTELLPDGSGVKHTWSFTNVLPQFDGMDVIVSEAELMQRMGYRLRRDSR